MSPPRDETRKPPDLPVLVHPQELVMRTWAEMFRAHAWLARRMERVTARHGLSTAQFDVLATLNHGEGISQQELARRLLVTKGNVCGLVDRMEAAGWLERRPDPDDRRANRLFLTDRGRALVAETIPEQRALMHEVLGGLGLAELWSLHELLSRIGAPGDD